MKKRFWCFRASRDSSTFMRYICYKETRGTAKTNVGESGRGDAISINGTENKVKSTFYSSSSIFTAFLATTYLPPLLASIFKSLVIYFFCWWRFEQFISCFNWFRMCSEINFTSSTVIACGGVKVVESSEELTRENNYEESKLIDKQESRDDVCKVYGLRWSLRKERVKDLLLRHSRNAGRNRPSRRSLASILWLRSWLFAIADLCTEIYFINL